MTIGLLKRVCRCWCAWSISFLLGMGTAQAQTATEQALDLLRASFDCVPPLEIVTISGVTYRGVITWHYAGDATTIFKINENKLDRKQNTTGATGYTHTVWTYSMPFSEIGNVDYSSGQKFLEVSCADKRPCAKSIMWHCSDVKKCGGGAPVISNTRPSLLVAACDSDTAENIALALKVLLQNQATNH